MQVQNNLGSWMKCSEALEIKSKAFAVTLNLSTQAKLCTEYQSNWQAIRPKIGAMYNNIRGKLERRDRGSRLEVKRLIPIIRASNGQQGISHIYARAEYSIPPFI